MNRLSISLKISIAYIAISIGSLGFLYFSFSNMYETEMLDVEKDKAELIAQTIEPMLGMNAYLGLTDEIKSLAEQTMKHEQIVGLHIIIANETAWGQPYDETLEHVHITYPIKNPLLNEDIGLINISYTMDNYKTAVSGLKTRMGYYLGLISILFAILVLVTRYMLSPLGLIASKVRDYKIGKPLELDDIRTDPETEAIINAFNKMHLNIREHTVLLERYKHSIDESAIVSRLDLQGNLIYINDEFCRTSGYSRDEIINSKCTKMIHQDMDDSVYSDLWETLQNNEVYKNTLKLNKKDGSEYYVKTTIVPIFDDAGNTIEYMSIQHDITQIIKQKEQISRQTTDETTGLPNRIKLEEDIQNNNDLKFALLSIDDYSVIKDYYGFESSKEILSQVAETLLQETTEDCLSVYKLASGEYGILSNKDCSFSDFNDKCKSIIKKIEDFKFIINENSFDIRVTAGITQNRDKLLSYASLALQHAYELKKSSIVYEDTENLIQFYENNLSTATNIKQALNDNRFTLFTQPIINTKTMAIEKYECLVRMIDKEGKVISPYFFLDVAKRSKLYHQITREVIRISFESFSKIPDVEFSINLSVEDLLHQETLDYLLDKLNEYDVASRLVLEIVESEGIDSFKEVRDFITQAKSLGCKIAIDDFGTGYSNFSYLLQLNVDYLKIDGSLIKSIDTDETSQIITKTILDFCKQLDIKTVAEFVHNQDVQDYVTNIEVDYLQGFHLGEPIPIESLIK